MQQYRKRFFNYKASSPPGQSSSTTLATLAENVEEAFKKGFCTINNSTQINPYNNDSFLLTTADDPWYRLDFFPANLKQKVVRLLKSQ